MYTLCVITHYAFTDGVFWTYSVLVSSLGFSGAKVSKKPGWRMPMLRLVPGVISDIIDATSMQRLQSLLFGRVD